MLTTARSTTFVITLLIIGTLAFDAWDFVRQITEAEPGLGWQLVLVVVLAGVAAVLTLAARCGGPVPRACASACPGRLLRRRVCRLHADRCMAPVQPPRHRADPGRLVPAPWPVRYQHAHRRHVHDRHRRHGGGGAARPRRSDLPRRVRQTEGARTVKPVIEILAGIPSVVLAYFAIAFINPNIVVRFFNPRTRRSRCSPPASPSAC